MAVEQRIYDMSLDADRNLEDYQYHIMALNGEFQCGPGDTNDEDLVGILQNKPELTGAESEIRRVGISKVVCGDTIPWGSRVTSDGNSHGVVATEGQRYVAIALQNGVDGRVISVLMEFGIAHAEIS